MRKIIPVILITLLFSCKKDTPVAAVATPPATNHDSTQVDYRNWMPVKNLTAITSSIDSLSISDTMYHISHIELINSGLSTDIRYFNVPTRTKCSVKFYLTLGNRSPIVVITIYQPDGTYSESYASTSFGGKDSITVTMPISNHSQVNLSHF